VSICCATGNPGAIFRPLRSGPRAISQSAHGFCFQWSRAARQEISQEVDGAIASARKSVAVFLNAAEPDEIAFGMNATSFIRLVSLALIRTFADRREIIVTDLDHEANIQSGWPWSERARSSDGGEYAMTACCTSPTWSSYFLPAPDWLRAPQRRVQSGQLWMYPRWRGRSYARRPHYYPQRRA
jgi:Aminotransferase class-V